MSIDALMRTSIERMRASGGHIELPLLDHAKGWVLYMRSTDRTMA
jgi:hypothetical protein